ncbi:PIN domain-containing protein [Methylomicrobium lacus]|uniref:PIN domain-containing protein n=1 Tax=Methylomicrobium lacus TaxID=136992 RepID=UPI0035A86934
MDTNIISEVMRPQPNPAVLAWLNRQDSTHLFITSVSIAEIGYGLLATRNIKDFENCGIDLINPFE